ncbi:hypothetical protein HZA40_02885 [Candidatus Peregrinibacteria bacterium]|nr:hypothetical protein [Candidatus Peregrinibacteria bacterium]
MSASTQIGIRTDDDEMSQKISTEVPKVSVRSKKGDIISAYDELLKKFQDNAEKAGGRKIEAKRKQENNLLEIASKISIDGVSSGISDLENEIRKLLSKLSELLIQEVKKLKELENAANVEQKRLEEIHNIKAEADTLANLIQAHKDKKNELEEEYVGKEDSLQRELEAKKEEWRREKDEYTYELQLSRRKEEADYAEKRMAKEKELNDREAAIKGVEDELKELRKLKIEFDQRLTDELDEARLEAAYKAKEAEEVKAKILAEKTAADKQIAEITIKGMEKKIVDQEDDMLKLKKELDVANKGVKDIAIKVIEGDARRNENRRPLKAYESENKKEENFVE